jgi:3-isopropylmalate dehydrogenase
MLDHFGRGELAARVEAAVVASIEHGRPTPDLGGQLSTAEVGKWIMEQIAGARAAST